MPVSAKESRAIESSNAWRDRATAAEAECAALRARVAELSERLESLEATHGRTRWSNQ